MGHVKLDTSGITDADTGQLENPVAEHTRRYHDLVGETGQKYPVPRRSIYKSGGVTNKGVGGAMKRMPRRERPVSFRSSLFSPQG